MSKTNNKLLWILAVLLLVRFGFEPLWAWQTEQSEQLRLNQQRAERVSLLLSRYASAEEQQQQLDTLKKASQQFPHSSHTQYRLELQQQLQQLFTEKGVQMELFDWVAEEQVAQTKLYKAVVQMRWIGNTSQVVAAHSSIDTTPNMRVTNMTPTWFEALRPDTELKTSVELEVYYVSQPE